MDLLLYNESFQPLIEQYNLSEEQLEFTGTPLECIELAKEDRNRHCILAMEGEELVTFFVLHEKEGPKIYSDNPKAILLRAFSTDFNHQGKGYAKQSLVLLPDFVRAHFPHITEIVLGVNLRNTAAQALYKKCGYVDEGRRMMGKRGEQIVMSYYI